MTVYTIGHSTHTPDRFADLMHQAGVAHAVDIRSHRSSKWEWWTEPHVWPWMHAAGLTYTENPRLGGWNLGHEPLASWAFQRGVNLHAYLGGHFPKQRIGKDADQGHIPAQYRSGWTNQGLHDYCWYMATDDFKAGIDQLLALPGPVAIFCSEVLWWKCHRSMVADYLVANGHRVQHIMPGSKSNPVRVTEHPTNRLDRYPYTLKEN